MPAISVKNTGIRKNFEFVGGFCIFPDDITPLTLQRLGYGETLENTLLRSKRECRPLLAEDLANEIPRNVFI
jgi:hypothetical protein